MRRTVSENGISKHINIDNNQILKRPTYPISTRGANKNTMLD